MSCDLIYWEAPEGEAEASLAISDRQGRLVHYAAKQLQPVAGRNPIRWELQLGMLSMGAYLVEVEIDAPEGGFKLRGRLDVGLTRAAFGRDWEQTRSLLREYADTDQWQALGAAAPEQRPAAWQEFWAQLDPNGAAPGNSPRETFWWRFSEANARFSSAFQDGYRSDRGRVFLELGEPDRIETFQDDRNFRVLLYWHYSRLGRVYIFEDRQGYENYTLIRVSG